VPEKPTRLDRTILHLNGWSFEKAGGETSGEIDGGGGRRPTHRRSESARLSGSSARLLQQREQVPPLPAAPNGFTFPNTNANATASTTGPPLPQAQAQAQANGGRTSVYEPLSNLIPSGRFSRMRGSISGNVFEDVEAEGGAGAGGAGANGAAENALGVLERDGSRRKSRRRGVIGSVSLGRSRSNTVFDIEEEGGGGSKFRFGGDASNGSAGSSGVGASSVSPRRSRSASSPVVSPTRILGNALVGTQGEGAVEQGGKKGGGAATAAGKKQEPASVRVSFIVKATPAGTLPASFVNMLSLQLPSAVGKLAQYLTSFGFA
jgi:hypothetical protein